MKKKKSHPISVIYDFLPTDVILKSTLSTGTNGVSTVNTIDVEYAGFNR